MSSQADRGAHESAPSGRAAETGTTRRGTRSRPAARDTERADTAAQQFAEAADSEPRRPRTGAKRTITDTVRELPNYLRLLWGLMWDKRVPQAEKLIVGAAIAYILIPIDWIPDFIPFFGEIDDVFLLVMSLQRLVQSAGRRVLLDHWAGEPAALEDMNMVRVVAAAAFFLPRRLRRRLRAIGRL